MNKILVTGGAGFIGSNLIKKLKEENYTVVSIDNYSTGSKSNHIEGCKYIDYDIVNKLTDLNLSEVSVVFHLAASARIQKSFQNPILYFDNNVIGTMNVVQYCVSQNIPLIYAGSSSHHSGRLSNPYTCTKDMGEDLINLYSKHFNLMSSICRFYSVYGPGEPIDSNGMLIGKWKNNYLNKKPFIVYGDGNKKRDFTHVDDIVEGLICIMVKSAYGYTFELGSGKNYSLNEIIKLFEYDNIIYQDNKQGEADSTLCDYSLAKNILDWVPRKNIQDYIKDITIANRSI
jgi:UDP-glucose 4-epimerase